MARWKEQFLVQAIQEGMEIDPTPCTALEWKSILDDGNEQPIALYRIQRILWMLVHTGNLYMIKREGRTYFVGNATKTVEDANA